MCLACAEKTEKYPYMEPRIERLAGLRSQKARNAMLPTEVLSCDEFKQGTFSEKNSGIARFSPVAFIRGLRGWKETRTEQEFSQRQNFCNFTV